MEIKQIRIKIEDKDRDSLIRRLSFFDTAQPIRKVVNPKFKKRSIREE